MSQLTQAPARWSDEKEEDAGSDKGSFNGIQSNAETKAPSELSSRTSRCPLDEFVESKESSQEGIFRLFSNALQNPEHKNCLPVDDGNGLVEELKQEISSPSSSQAGVLRVATKMVAQSRIHNRTCCADCIAEWFSWFADIRSCAPAPVHQTSMIQQTRTRSHQRMIHRYVCILLQMAILLAHPASLQCGIHWLSAEAVIRFALCPSANYVLQRIIRQKARTGNDLDLSNIIHPMCWFAADLARHNIACRLLVRLFEACALQDLYNLADTLLNNVNFLLSTEKYQPFSFDEATGQMCLNSKLPVWKQHKDIQYATFGGAVLTELVKKFGFKNHPEIARQVLQTLHGSEAQAAQKYISYVWQVVAFFIPHEAFETLRHSLGQAQLEDLMRHENWAPWLRRYSNMCHRNGEVQDPFFRLKQGRTPMRSTRQ